jgi:hypothetical protein
MDHTSNTKTAVRHTVLSVVVIPEKAASPEEAFVATVLEEIVYLEAAMAVVAVVPTEEPAAMVTATQHTREAVRRNAAQHPLS